MKNLSVVLNVVLLIAVAFLYIDKFSSNGSETSIMSLSDVNADTSGINSGELTIAYINSDTLLAKYAFYDEINELLNQKRTQAQNQFESRARSLQQEIESFQRTVDGMTINQARAKEEELLQKRENLQRFENNLGQELMAEENKLTNELYDVIADYLAIYGKEKGINIILTYTKGSGVIYADEGLDITQDAIKGLNERHAASRPTN